MERQCSWPQFITTHSHVCQEQKSLQMDTIWMKSPLFNIWHRYIVLLILSRDLSKKPYWIHSHDISTAFTEDHTRTAKTRKTFSLLTDGKTLKLPCFWSYREKWLDSQFNTVWIRLDVFNYVSRLQNHNVPESCHKPHSLSLEDRQSTKYIETTRQCEPTA